MRAAQGEFDVRLEVVHMVTDVVAGAAESITHDALHPHQFGQRVGELYFAVSTGRGPREKLEDIRLQDITRSDREA